MEQSSMWLQHTHAADGGGFVSDRAVRLINASLYILDSMAESFGGGFCCGALELTGSLMTVRGGKAASSGAFFVASIYGGSSHVSIVDSRVYVEECTAKNIAGGFSTRQEGELRIAGSVLKVLNARAGRRSGGFDVGSLQVSSSVIELENTTADWYVGAFTVWRRMVVGNHSKITLFRTFAVEQFGGFNAEKGFEVVDGSMLSIHEAKTLGPCGAFGAFASVQIAGASTLRVSRSTAQAGDGGGLCLRTRAGEVLVTGRSQLAISDATSGGKGGGLQVLGSLRVTDQSVVHLERCSAAGDGGGAYILGDVVVAHGSRFLVSDAMAGGEGGGLNSESVKIVEGSRLELQAVSAARGGGFYTYQFVVVAGSSTLTVSGSDAKLKGGAFVVERTLRVTKQSRLEAENSRAQENGGTFAAETVSASEGSEIVIRNGSAGQNGGCVWSQKLELSDSMLEASECVAHVDGGGFHADKVTLSRAQVRISGSALERGGGFFAQELEAWNSELWVAGLDSMAQPAKPGADAVLGSGAFVGGPLRLANSAVHLHNLWGKSALASRCLLLSQSTLSLDAATEVGISVQNALCSCHATHVAGVDFPSLHLEGALVGMGVSSALLSVEPCGNETLEIAHVHFRTSHAAVAKTTAHTRLRNITVEYLEAIHEIQLLTAPSFEAETVQVSCPACAQGVTFASGTSGLRAVSPPSLHCEKTALLNGTTARCGCFFPQQVPDKHYGDDVEVSETGSYCMYCPSHSQARGEDCEKCPLHK
ncbi:GIP, partial [Symbiodinium necroappetens]